MSNRTVLPGIVAHADWEREVRTRWLQRELRNVRRIVVQVLKPRGRDLGYKDSKTLNPSILLQVRASSASPQTRNIAGQLTDNLLP